MDVLTIIISVVNLIFAALGIFVTAETLKLRASEKENKKNTSGNSVDISDFKDDFPKSFINTRLGSQVVEAEYLYRDANLNPKKSKLITMYRKQGYIQLTRFFHPISIWEENDNHLAFAYYQMFLYFTPILITIFIFTLENKAVLAIYLSLVVLLYLTPFGIYGDLNKNSKAKVIFSFFSLGRVKNVRCIIEEQATDDFKATIYFEIKFLGLLVKIPKEIKINSVKDAVLEYLIVKKFANPEEEKFSYRCIGVANLMKT